MITIGFAGLGSMGAPIAGSVLSWAEQLGYGHRDIAGLLQALAQKVADVTRTKAA